MGAPAQVSQVQEHPGAEVEARAILVSEEGAGAWDWLVPLSDGLQSSGGPV